MGYLTAKKFSEKWEISERRIIKLCSENRISGAIKDGMVWLIPEDTIKPSDKRSNIYKYINIPKKILIVNIKEEIKEFLIDLLNKQGYISECKDFNSIGELSKYYEGLIFFANKKSTEIFGGFLIYIKLSSYCALAPPINFGRVLAHKIFALPRVVTLSRSGTATSLKCIPISVPPMSIPPSALMCSRATGFLSSL